VLLAKSIGASNTALMTMTGDPIDAQAALAWGLVSEVLESDAFVPRAIELAKTRAGHPPIAKESANANLAAAYHLPLAQAVAYERELQGIAFATADADKGRAALAEKRPGVFHRL
jgi:enoyl-CoA hydratase/carnithine racemase